MLVCAALLACSPDRNSIGHTCKTHDDCEAELQCLQSSCAPLCHVDSDCGDGYTCSPAGFCDEIVSELGQACTRELDCGPGQTCQLSAEPTGDGTLDRTCQPDQPGGITGSTCSSDADCRNHLCSLGRCSELCATNRDCPAGTRCVSIPRVLEDSAPLFDGCLQAEGTLVWPIANHSPHREFLIPVPDNALSVAVVAQIDEDSLLVGAARVISPSGTLLYATPFSQEEYYQNPLRHQPTPLVSTLIIPNTPRIQLENGVYQIEIASFFDVGITGTAVPQVSVIYKLSPADRLDLHFRFLDLQNHPCSEYVGVLDAKTAETSRAFQTEFIDQLRSIFQPASIELGSITYDDVKLRGDLDGLEIEDLPTLLRLSEHDEGVTIFFVRSISPAGIQAIAGGTPGPPRTSGTAASGIAVSFDTLCYREWRDVARATAHEIGRYLGLFRNREPDGANDPIDDSDQGTDNLMFYGEFGGVQLSPGQGAVLKLNPGLR